MPAHRLATFALLVLAGLHPNLRAADGPPPVDPAVTAALALLPEEAQPEELRRARNGAYYVLLPNGAELIVKEKRNAPVVAVQAWVRTGAIDEAEWLGAGLSHFCEHLLFKGSAKYPTGKLDQLMRGAGADDNAYTSSERTVYHATGDAQGFPVLFDALSDMVMNSTFPPEEVTKEHAVVVKEIERALDDPDSRLWDAFERTLYQVHPYRVPVLGYPDRFTKVTREEVFAYYQRRYAPQLTSFIVVGDVSAAEALPLMAQAVAGWARKSVARPAIPVEPPQVAPREVTLTHPLCKLPKFYLGLPSVSLRDGDLYALDVLASILGDGRSSRLYRKVQDELRLVHEISCWNYTPSHPGMFAVNATLDSNKIEAARKAVWAVFEEAKKQKPSKEELERAKKKVATQHVFGQMTAEGLAEALGGDWFAAGDLDFSQTYVDGIQAVSAEQVVEAARRYLLRERENFALLLPGAEGAGAPRAEPSTPATAPASGAARQATEFPPLANGLRVVVREDRSLPTVHAAVVALGGLRQEPAELAGAGNLLAELLDRGTKKLNKEKLAAAIEDLGASLNTFGGSNTYGLTLRCLKEDLPALLDLAAGCFTEPAFPDDELEKARTEILARLEAQDEYIWSINNKVFKPKLWGEHPYARHTLGTLETVKKLSAADLRALHAKWAQPGRMAVALVGDLDAQAALALVQERFGKLSPQGAGEPATFELQPLAGKREGQREQEGLEGAALALGFRTVDLKSPERYALDVAAGVLEGLGGRLGVKIREEQGLAYGVGAYHSPQLDGGAFVLYVQTDAEKLKRCEDSFWEVLNELRKTPISEEELASAKKYLAGHEAVQLQDLGDLAQRLALSQVYGQGAASVFETREKLNAVTAQQVHEAVLKYLTPENYAKAIVKPK
ncbi:MAG: insulinase family protein [Planctomycetota bacterium]|nr:insulinase family protein [Planctomycetota bacterium]